MLETITLSQIAAALAFLAALIGSAAVILKAIKKSIVAAVSGEIQRLDDKIDEQGKKLDGIRAQIDTVDIAATKNFLVRFLADVEHGNPVDEVERLRFHEQYEHYQRIGGNSYIKDKVEKLKAAGKL